jgi:Xaa-Pro aminopeptidase
MTKTLSLDGAAGRLSALRATLAAAGLDGFIVPRADEHLGEYVPPSAERLAWLTGFTGSAGIALVLAERAAVFSDGRYVLQLSQETDGTLWERLHVTDNPPPAWLRAHAPEGARIGYDPWLMSEEAVARFAEAGRTMVAVETNPLDAAWTDRPAPPDAPLVAHPLEYAGRPAAEKCAAVAQGLREAGQSAAVLTDPASVAWLLNVRGSDLPFTPVALAFALLHDDARVTLFVAEARVDAALRAALGEAVTIAPRAALADALKALSGRRVRVDAAGAPAWFAQTLRDAGAEVVAGSDPCLLPKACKNAAEQAGARAAHLRDGAALCRFLHWLDATVPGGDVTEMAAAERLLAFRAALPLFSGESFPAISGAGEHGAVIHYRVTPATDRALRTDEVYLIDSGGQFRDGTTDVTRTVWTGAGPAPATLRAQATAVLKGHIAIATLVFPQGVAGAHIDAFARRALWADGLDYDHGTGHGVGSFLSVHEGPASISRAARPVPIAAGMILSNEPGLYVSGAYGIRLENLLLAHPVAVPGPRPFLCFETLTLAPFDRRLIEPLLLDPVERLWVDDYHARVLAAVGPLLPPESRDWLVAACAPLR